MGEPASEGPGSFREIAPRAPSLRSDLVVSEQASRERTYFVLKDPTRARFFRLGPSEYSIARNLDGTRTLEEIRAIVEAESGGELPERDLVQFVEKLRRMGLLQEGDTGAHDAPHQRRGRGSLLYWRLLAFDPGRLLDRMTPWLGFFFTPTFVAGSALLIVLAGWITFMHALEIGRDIVGLHLFQFHVLAIAYGIVFLVIGAHEFAHGLTCRHFGGRVQEMGFLLLYFQPTFYCNVSDAWLFPQKSRRLWVTLAGAYFELFLWALATLLWRVMEPDTWPSRAALIVMATSGIRTLFNLNPLIKLDGYYLLSDLLEVPNLRRNAFAYLKQRLTSPLGGEAPVGVSHRERRIYLVYGLLSFVYSLWILELVIRYIGGSLVRKYQGWGFLLFAGLLGTVFQGPLTRSLRGGATMFGTRQGIKRAVVRLVKLAFVVVPVGLALFLGYAELKVSGEFTILPAENADVRAEVDGIIQQIFVDEGSDVQKGDPLALLSDRDYRTEATKIKAEIEEKQAMLRLLQAGPRAEEVQLARTSVEKAASRLAFAQVQLTRIEPLFDEKLLSRKELEDAQELAAVREKELEEAKGHLDVLEAGSRPEEIEALEAGITRLTTQQHYLGGELRSVKVMSPITGVVTTRNLKERIGEAVHKGDLIAKVHDLSTVMAEIAVPERDISDVRVGERVVLKVRAYPESAFEGRVESIAPTATQPDEGKVERTVVVTTRLENPSHLLKAQMTGNAKVYCGERRLLDIVTRRITRYVRVEFWSWW